MTRLNGYLDSFVDQGGFRQHGGIFSGISRGDMILQSSGVISISGAQQVTFSAFGGSGALRYNSSGSYTGWEVKDSIRINNPIGPLGPTTDPEGYAPLLVSGITTFQHLYRAAQGNDIYLFAQYGDLNIISNTKKFMVQHGQRASPRLSGILYVPVNTGNTNNEQGDVMSCLHGMMTPYPKFVGALSYTDPATIEEAQARSLGVGTLFFNTGSGITNISIGSGIEQTNFTTYKGTTTFPLYANKEVWARLPISTIFVDDRNQTYSAGISGLSIMSAGLYRVHYNCSFRRELIASALRGVCVRAILQAGKAGGGSPLLPNNNEVASGSYSYADSSNLNSPCCSVSHEFLLNMDANDFLGLEAVVQDRSVTTGQSFLLTTSGTLLYVQKIGPKRGNF